MGAVPRPDQHRQSAALRVTIHEYGRDSRHVDVTETARVDALGSADSGIDAAQHRPTQS
jgi:hypothetical protein